MEKLAVQATNMTLSVAQLQSQRREIQRLAIQVNMIRCTLPFKIRQRADIENQLQHLSLSLVDSATDLRHLAQCLQSAAHTYMRCENGLASFDLEIPQVSGGSGANLSPTVFEEGGAYGGDQRGPFNLWSDGTDDQKDQLRKIIRRYSPYQDYSDAEIVALLKKLDSEGCGYVALVNTIFNQYAGRPDEFEATFGFPMYRQGVDGTQQLNYEYLITDFYAATDNGYFPSKESKTGAYFKYEDYNFSGDYKDENIFSYDYKADSHGNGTEQNQRKNRFEYYMSQHGIDTTVIETGAFSYGGMEASVENCQKHIDNGEYVMISVSPKDDVINMYDPQTGKRDVPVNGEHVMLVTGVTDDEQLIVSSWGHQYYLDLDDVPKAYIDTVQYH